MSMILSNFLTEGTDQLTFWSGGKLVPQSFIQNLPKILLETAGSNFVFIFQVDLYFSIKFATPSSS